MKTVYVSLPMTGKEDTIWERYQNALAEIKSMDGYADCKIISPVGIYNFNPINAGKPVEDHTWGWYMGRDLELLADSGCSDIYFCDGWQTSKGCRVEHETAIILEINRIYQSDKNI